MTCSWRSLPSGVSRISRQGSAAAGSSSPRRSWPAEKCLPLAAMMTTRTLSSASARSKAADSSSSMAVLWALAASGRFRVTMATAPSTSYSTAESVTRQPQHALADDVALDLVGAGEDRRGLVVEPRALPGAVARIAISAAPQRRRRAQNGHCGLVQALAHLAPVQLQCRPLGPRLQTLLHPGQRAPVVELEQLHLYERLGEALAQAPVVPRAGLRRQTEQRVEQLQVNDQLA